MSTEGFTDGLTEADLDSPKTIFLSRLRGYGLQVEDLNEDQWKATTSDGKSFSVDKSLGHGDPLTVKLNAMMVRNRIARSAQ